MRCHAARPDAGRLLVLPTIGRDEAVVRKKSRRSVAFGFLGFAGRDRRRDLNFLRSARLGATTLVASSSRRLPQWLHMPWVVPGLSRGAL
jgi:hypothetical protein